MTTQTKIQFKDLKAGDIIKYTDIANQCDNEYVVLHHERVLGTDSVKIMNLTTKHCERMLGDKTLDNRWEVTKHTNI